MSHDDVVIATSIAQALLMALLPIGVAVWSWRRARSVPGDPRWLLAIGAATFLGSQVVHLPLNVAITWVGAKAGLNEALDATSALFVNALVLGFTAALCEEGSRFLVFRWSFSRRPEWRTREGALAHGVGHGGIESLALGALVAVTLVGMLSMRGADFSQWQLPEAQRAVAERQVAEFWSMPAWLPFVGVLERALTMMLHTMLSVWVAFGVATRSYRPVLAAFAIHWAIDALAVLAIGGAPLLQGGESSRLGIFLAEGVMLLVAIGAWVSIRRARRWAWPA
jgi:uncharacterized membrane protein YhfC